MAFGITPTGDWKKWNQQTFNLTSTSSAKKGSLVKFDGARNVAEYTSVDSHYLGVQMHASSDSLPTGKCTVAIPTSGARAVVDVWTGMTASQLSLGQAYTLSRNGDTPCSILTTLATSVFSRIVTITGPIDSVNSRIEVAFIQNEAVFGSTSSVSIS